MQWDGAYHMQYVPTIRSLSFLFERAGQIKHEIGSSDNTRISFYCTLSHRNIHYGVTNSFAENRVMQLQVVSPTGSGIAESADLASVFM